MKKIFLFALLTSLSVTTLTAQTTFPPLDKSPLDVSYCPDKYPSRKNDTNAAISPLVARVLYSRPQKNGRVIFGDLVPYGKVWRLGANEATEIDFFTPVKINGKAIEAGRYTLYAIPEATKWTLILNKETDIWGAYTYDEKKDVLRAEVPVTHPAENTEALSILFVKTSGGADLTIAWDNIQVALPVTY